MSPPIKKKHFCPNTTIFAQNLLLGANHGQILGMSKKRSFYGQADCKGEGGGEVAKCPKELNIF